MEELAKRRLVIKLERYFYTIGHLDLNTQDVSIVNERLVHDLLRSIHNAIVYIRSQQGILQSLDKWARRVESVTEDDESHEIAVGDEKDLDVAITAVLSTWAELFDPDWQDICRLAITKLSVDERNKLDEHVTLLYFLVED